MVSVNVLISLPLFNERTHVKAMWFTNGWAVPYTSAMNEPIISVSGLRGIIGESLSPELAMRFSCAFAALAPSGPIVIARDGRATGRMLADAIRSALQAVGRTVIEADVAAMPTT